MAGDWSRHVEGGDSCIVHVAMRPAHRIRTWTACETADGASLDAAIAKNLPAPDVAAVNEGTVVLAIKGATGWAAGEGIDRFPKAWAAAAAGESMEMEALVDRAWPK